jgi:hypothetical protein
VADLGYEALSGKEAKQKEGKGAENSIQPMTTGRMKNGMEALESMGKTTCLSKWSK